MATQQQKKIFRRKITKDFVRIQNDILTNDKLSWKAKGLLCFMLSRKDDWHFHKVQVQKYSTDGRDGTISAFNELIKAGYVKQIRKRDTKGKFVAFDYLVYDTPFTENPNSDNPKVDKPFTENPFTGNPNSENPYLVTTQGSNTDSSNTVESNKDINKTYQGTVLPGSAISAPDKNLIKNLSYQELWDMGIEVDPKEYLNNNLK